MSMKLGITGLAAAVGLAFLPAAAMGQMGQIGAPEWQIAGYGGYAAFSKLGDLGTSDVKAKGAAALGFTVTRYLNENWGVRAAWGYMPSKLETKPVPEGVTATSGTEIAGMKVYTLDVTVLYRFPLRSLEPYVLAGAGGIVFDPNRDAIDNGLLANGDVNRAFMTVFGVGVNVPVGRMLALNAEITDHLAFKSIDPETFTVADETFKDKAVHSFGFVGGFTVLLGR